MPRIIKKVYNPIVKYNGNDNEFQFSSESKERIQEFINNHMRVVCLYHSIDEYRVSTTPLIKYTTVDHMDAVGRIVSLNYDTCEVEIELIDECDNPNTHLYIDPNEMDKYQLKIRGMFGKTAGDDSSVLNIKFITFDLIRIDIGEK